MRYRPHALATALALSMLGAGVAQAQESPANLTGRLMALSVAIKVCSIDATAQQQAELDAAGEKMQKKAGLSDAELQAATPDVVKTVTESCGNIKPNFSALLAQTLAAANAVE